MKLVYFLKPIGMAGPVKIGCSCWPEQRLKALDIWSPFPLELIASVPGAHIDEKRLHWRFRESRSHGEWYFVTPDLLGLIDHVRINGALPPLESDPPKAKQLKPVGPNRQPGLRYAKTRLSSSIRMAERHAYGWFHRDFRAQWVCDAIASWQGLFTPYPSDELVERIRAYNAELLSRPRETRTFRELADARDKRRAAACRSHRRIPNVRRGRRTRPGAPPVFHQRRMNDGEA